MHPVLSLCLLAGVLLAGCATPQPMTVEERVGNRALQWADALIAQDYEQALTFMTPTYQNSPRAERFRGDFGGSSYWQGAELKWVKCDEKNTPVVRSGNDRTVAVAQPAGNAKSNTGPRESADDCRVSAWEDCGQPLGTSTPTSSTMSMNSDRCQARLILAVMRAPEMSFPMAIPYELTWLNISGGWYIYHQ
jgi:hypothetical protein